MQQYTTSKHALELLSYGLQPVLLGRAGDALKLPQHKNWQTRTITTSDVKAWRSGHNIGIRGGAGHDGRNLVVFDFDYEAARIFPEWRAAAAGVVAQPLVIATSGKGYHVYLFTSEPKVGEKLAAEIATNENGKPFVRVFVETLGVHKQVVSVGSLHPSGRHYAWAAGSPGYGDIPTITETQYNDLVGLARGYDRRPAPKPAARQVAATGGWGTGELAHVANCLDYAHQFIGGEEKTQRNGDIKLDGHGGLILTGDGAGWYCFSDDKGGGLAALVAWHKGISLPEAYKLLRPVANFKIETSKGGVTIELKEGSFLGDVDYKPSSRHTYLQANTGIGKTTWATTLPGRVVLVLPTQALVEQQGRINPAARLFYQYAQKPPEDDTPLIITTPDSLTKLLAHIDASQFYLVVDEAHEIHVAGYRKRAYDNVVQLLNGAWRGVVLMSGTPLPVITQDLQVFEPVSIVSPLRRQTAQRVSWQDDKGKGDQYATAVALMPDPATGKRVMVYLNDKRRGLDAIIFELKRRGYDPAHIGVINADRRDSHEYKCLVEHEALPDDIRVLITTAVIGTGFNIRDEFDMVFLLSRVSHAEAQQIANRLRTSAAGRVYWFNNGQEKRARGDIDGAGQRIAKMAAAMVAELNHQGDNGDAYEASLAAIMRLGRGGLVNRVVDELTGAAVYEVSAVGACNMLYKAILKGENDNPELFKANTARYGWVWGDDIHLVHQPDKTTRRVYQTEQESERLCRHEQDIFTLLAWGLAQTKHYVKHEVDALEKRVVGLGRFTLDLSDKLGMAWAASCQAALYGMGSQRRENTIKRQLEIQAGRGSNGLTRAVYRGFAVGEKLTGEHLQARLLAIYGRGRVLAVYTRARYEGDDPLPTNKAVSILGDYFHMKRCKITQENGQRVNGYELVDDCPRVELRQPLKGDTIRIDALLPAGAPVSHLSCDTLGVNCETPTGPPPTGSPQGQIDLLAGLFETSDSIRRRQIGAYA